VCAATTGENAEVADAASAATAGAENAKTADAVIALALDIDWLLACSRAPDRNAGREALKHFAP